MKRELLISVLLGILGGVLLLSSNFAQADHTVQPGTCFGDNPYAWGYYWCLDAYEPWQPLTVLLHNNIAWGGEADWARWHWGQTNGPQKGRVTWYWEPNAHSIYLNTYDTGVAYARAYNCNLQYCTGNLADPNMNWVFYSVLDFDPENMAGTGWPEPPTYEGRVHIIAHEIGHALGLDHHGHYCIDWSLMNDWCSVNVSAHRAHDYWEIGDPACPNWLWGIRCLYDWWW